MRAFIAFDFPEELKSKLYEIQNLLKNISNKGSWVNKNNFHLTLKFLGEIDLTYVEDINKILKNISEQTRPLNIKLNELGYFNKRDNEYRVLWTGLDGDLNRLNSVYNLLEGEMDKIGFPRERRKFSPHITLVRRFKSNLDFNKIKEYVKPYLESQYVLDNLVLMKSEVIMNKRVYTPIVSYKLIKGEIGQ
ncbi:MAG: RNA 2',3'-cyclic phosphodiesterase [Tissierellia bacterium]|nr:RNA 2',3'-cyclic phosphodiesterase [Tissierellia bacterium]